MDLRDELGHTIDLVLIVAVSVTVAASPAVHDSVLCLANPETVPSRLHAESTPRDPTAKHQLDNTRHSVAQLSYLRAVSDVTSCLSGHCGSQMSR